jgi:hypothetical protein
VLRDGLDRAPAASLKSVWFSALRDTAQTPPTIEWLTRVWKHDEKVPGLPLAETDDIRLAEEIAVRGVPGRRRILEQQLERTKNPDRKAQLAFARRRCRRIRRSATRGSRRCSTVATAATSRGCSRGCATCTIRCAPASR